MAEIRFGDHVDLEGTRRVKSLPAPAANTDADRPVDRDAAITAAVAGKVDSSDVRLVKRTVELLVSDPGGAALTTGDGKAFFRVPVWMNGAVVSDVGAAVSTVSSSGAPTAQVRRVRAGSGDADVLSTPVSVDVSEIDSSTAATQPVINTANDDLLTGDQLHVDVDVAGTGTKGLLVSITVNL